MTVYHGILYRGVLTKPAVLTCTSVQVTCDRYGIDRYRCGVTQSHPRCDPCYTLVVGLRWCYEHFHQVHFPALLRQLCHLRHLRLRLHLYLYS
jgi:hypothetical protein